MLLAEVTDKNYWVLEFKFCREKESPDFLLQEAVRQIKTRHYGEQLVIQSINTLSIK